MLNSDVIPSNAYTDRPALHANGLVGSLQILGWLLFHPSAWRNYLAMITPNLEVDFVIGDLRATHWREPGLRRLLILTYLIAPVAVGVITALVLWLIGVPDPFVRNALAGTSYAFAAAVAVGIGVSCVAAPIYGPLMGLLVGIALPIWGGIAHAFIYSATVSIASSLLLGLTSIRPEQSTKKTVAGFILALVVTGLIVALIYSIVSFARPHPTPEGARQPPENTLIIVLEAALVGGVIYGLVVWQRSKRWPSALLLGGVIALTVGPSYGLLLRSQPEQLHYHIVAGISGGILFGGLFVVPYMLGKFLAGIWAGAIVGSLIGGLSWIPLAPHIFPQTLPTPTSLLLLSSLTLVVGLCWIGWQRLVCYPFLMGWNIFLYQRDKSRSADAPSLLRFHSAFWDEFQFLPLPGLDTHLILVAERTPQEGQNAINYLAATRQRWAAKIAQVELYARQLDRCTDIEALKNVHRLLAGDLSGPANALIGHFRRHSQDIRVALSHDTDYHRQKTLSTVCEDLNRLVRELNLTQNPYAQRFQPIALHWYHIILNYQAQLIQAQEINREIANPYIVGLPLSEDQQEIFVGRQDLITRVQQFLRDGHRTALLLYGQRRMGKTSLLQNLGRFLPSTIVPLFVDEQGTAYSTTYADHLYSIVRQMTRSAKTHRGLDFPPLSHEALAANPFIVFTDWLDAVEQVLDDHGKSMFLLMLDEIEVLKQMIDKGRLDVEDLLHLFRNLIQHRPKFKVLVAGSHALEELQDWASYLINMEVIKIGCLSTEETLRLIERPVPHFNLHYHPEASQRIVKLTRGHPYLTQLLCHEIVIGKNQQPTDQRNWVLPPDVEEAIPNALNVGNLFFANIQKNQVDEQGTALLQFLATQGEGACVARSVLAYHVTGNLSQTLTRLQRRDLIEEVDGYYRFSIELIRRWFAQ